MNDNDFLELFDATFLEDPALAERAAKLWHYLLTEIERGPEGITQARNWLEQAIRHTFPFTRTYFLCRELFEDSLAEGSEAPLAALMKLKAESER